MKEWLLNKTLSILVLAVIFAIVSLVSLIVVKFDLGDDNLDTDGYPIVEVQQEYNGR